MSDVVEVSDQEVFLGLFDFENQTPKVESIPEILRTKNKRNKWNRLVADWQEKGVKFKSIKMKDGFDKITVFRYISAILTSYKQNIDIRMLHVAYVLDQFVDHIEYETMDKFSVKKDDQPTEPELSADTML